MKKLLSFLIFLSLAGKIIAQVPVKDQTLLWEVSGKDLKAPSYLFGTYHLIGKNFIDTMPGLQAKLKASRTVVGELMFDSLDIRSVMGKMVMKDITIDKLLSAKEYDQLKTYFKGISLIPLEALNNMKPAAIQVMITAFTAPVKVDENDVLDKQLQKIGKEAGKKVLGLETAGYQMDLLLGAPIREQKESLMKIVANGELMKQKGLELYQRYIRQDLAGLEAMVLDPAFLNKAENEKMLVARNRQWMKTLPAEMQNGSTFVAVGAAHLVGDDGLIALFRKAGYTVSPVSTK